MIDRDRKRNGLALTVATYQARRRRKTQVRVADASIEWRNLPPNAFVGAHVFFSIQTERKRSENYTTLYFQTHALLLGCAANTHQCTRVLSRAVYTTLKIRRAIVDHETTFSSSTEKRNDATTHRRNNVYHAATLARRALLCN